DPQAITATCDNAAKNGVTGRIHCCMPDELPALKADVLLANILANPLTELVATITAHVKPGGDLILSGILVDQITTVNNAYQPSFDLDRPALRDEWARLSGKRKI
ncbi:MAG: 50S ribosomal protein L11 methyltransferase, partial [Pseudomonadota bacterium]